MWYQFHNLVWVPIDNEGTLPKPKNKRVVMIAFKSALGDVDYEFARYDDGAWIFREGGDRVVNVLAWADIPRYDVITYERDRNRLKNYLKRDCTYGMPRPGYRPVLGEYLDDDPIWADLNDDGE